MTIYTYHYANVSGGLGHHDMHTSRKLKLVTSTNSLISTSRGEISTINNWHYYKVQSYWFIKTNLGYSSENSILHVIETIRIYYHENWKRQIQFAEWKRPKPSATTGKAVFVEIWYSNWFFKTQKTLFVFNITNIGL